MLIHPDLPTAVCNALAGKPHREDHILALFQHLSRRPGSPGDVIVLYRTDDLLRRRAEQLFNFVIELVSSSGLRRSLLQVNTRSKGPGG